MNLYESIYRYVILTCRATFLSRSEGLGHAERRPHASWLRQVESYLKDTGMAVLASVWAMVSQRPREYRRKVDAATRCSGV